MNYPTHLPTVAGRVPDPYIGQRAALAELAEKQAAFGRFLEWERATRPMAKPSGASERKLLSRIAYGLVAVVVAVEVLFCVLKWL